MKRRSQRFYKRILAGVMSVVVFAVCVGTEVGTVHAAEPEEHAVHEIETDVDEVVTISAETGVTVSNADDFLEALAQRKSPIIINGVVSVSNGVNSEQEMLPVEIPENTVIRGEVDADGKQPSIDFRGPIQIVGDNVVIKDIEMQFSSSTALNSVPHREIFLAGHSLTLDNVSTYLEGAGGSLGEFGGSESELLPTVYSGGFKGTSVGTAASLTIQNANEDTVIQAIYMGHDAGTDSKVAYTGASFLQMGEKVSIRDGIYANVNTSASVEIIGVGDEASSNNVNNVSFYGNANTILTVKNAILNDAAINNVEELVLDERAVFELSEGSLNNVTVKNGACLNLNSLPDVIVAGDFTGGLFDMQNSTDTRGYLVLNKEGSLTIEGTVKGETLFQTEDKNFPGEYTVEKTYVTSAGCEEGSAGFVLPDTKSGSYELKCENNAWTVCEKVLNVEVAEAVIISSPSAVDVSSIERWENPDENVPYCEIVWKDTDGNELSAAEIDELGLYYYGAVIFIKTAYWENETSGEETDYSTYVDMFPAEVNDGKYYFYTDSALAVESGKYTVLLCSEIYQGDLDNVADVKAVKDAGLVLTQFTVTFYNSSLGESPDTYLKDISNDSITLEPIVDREYTGNYIKPPVTICDDTIVLSEGKDYSLTYTDNINAGTARVTVTGKGNYTGTRETSFRIVKTQPAVTLTINKEETGEAEYGDDINFEVQISPYARKNEGIDYIKLYVDDTLLTTVELSETGNAAFVYSGTETRFAVGEHTVKAVFEGNDNLKASEKEGTFIISEMTPVPTPDPAPTPGEDEKTGLRIEMIDEGPFYYTGQAVKPTVKVFEGETELDAKDYKLSYSNNKNAGNAAEITVTGKGNYKGNDSIYFTIKKLNIKDEKVIVPQEVFTVIQQDGTVKKPKVTIKLGTKVLKANAGDKVRDYKIDYEAIPKDENNRYIPGEYEIWITGNGTNFEGSRMIVYRVIENTTLQMGKAQIAIAEDSPVKKIDYDAQEILPTFTVKIGKTKLKENVDYTIKWPKLEVGKNTIVFEPLETSQYSLYGTKTFTVTVKGTTIKQRDIIVEGIREEGYDYTGFEIIPGEDKDGKSGLGELKVLKVIARDENGAVAETELLTENKEYTLSYKKNKQAGTATVTITGIGGYTGKRTLNFTIKKINLQTADPSLLEIRITDCVVYNKKGAKAEVAVSYNGIELVEKQDYTLEYQGYKKVGENSATVTITGKGSFKGFVSKKFSVLQSDKTLITFEAGDIVTPATLGKVQPKITVVEEITGKKLSDKADYIRDTKYYSDEDCTKVITKEDLVTGKTLWAKIILKGNYGDGKTTVMKADFRLCTKLASSFKVEKIEPETYTSKMITPEMDGKVYIYIKENGLKKKVILEEGTHYTVGYPLGQNVNVGTGKIIIRGIGEYGGVKTVSFKITRKNVKFDVLEELMRFLFV